MKRILVTIYFVVKLIVQSQASFYELPTSGMRVVRPCRSDPLGHVVSNDLAFDFPQDENPSHSRPRPKRHARHSKHSSPQKGEPQGDGKLYVVIQDAEEELLLQLTPNTRLVTPNTVIEWLYEGGVRVVRRIEKNCFYSGRNLKAKGHSLVAVSNCDGLVGYIHTNNESYFIEPLTEELKRKFIQQSATQFDHEGNQTLFQEQRDRIYEYERLHRVQDSRNSGPRPHVIYKVNSVIDKLNLSVDQDFETPSKVDQKKVPSIGKKGAAKFANNRPKFLEKFAKISPKRFDKFRKQNLNFMNNYATNISGESLPSNTLLKGSKYDLKRHYKGKSRSTRSLDGIERFLKGGSRTYPQNRNSERGNSNDDVHNKGWKRRKRNNCKKKANKKTEFQKFFEKHFGEDLSTDENICLSKREKRERKRELKEKRRRDRERRKKERMERRKQRERKKKKKNKKSKKSDFDKKHSSVIDPLENEDWEGYSPDLLWETQIAPGQSGLNEVDYGSVVNESDPAKWLELTVGIDHTVIDFHGEDQVEKYVFTLFNIVSAIYDDPSLHANLSIVLLRLIFYKDKAQSKVKEGLAKRSLEAVNRWAETLYRLSSNHLQHDLAVWLTRLDLGGPSGYAPVSGVCDPSRSCTLNRDEGLTSAFIIAHEMGHVLGLSHDGDPSTENDCEPEGRLGSVMAPLVAATFGRFHWSRCSRKEYHKTARSWECLLNEPNWMNATVMSSSIQFQYSLDDQCRLEFGDGFGLCRTFGMSDPCTFLWCSNSSTPHLCKTKKGPPLEGTLCGDKMWCRNGFCEPIRHADFATETADKSSDVLNNKRTQPGPPIRYNPQHGGWSHWSEWGSCSRTCGTGIMFRTRECDNPIPRWGGFLCEGKREEWKVCSTDPCSEPGDLRAEQCNLLTHLVKLGKRRSKLQWLPYESKRRKKKCRITCVSPSTNEVYIGKEYLIDGTPCSYDDPHTICVQGKCIAMGCDSVIGSRAKWDDCGVCNGNGSSCRRNTFIFKGVPDTELRQVVVLPKGAWKISVRENQPTTNFLSIRDNSSELVLNSHTKQEPQREFISEGTQFRYIRKGEQETLLALGPLLRPVTIMIHGGVVREEVTITTTFLTRENPRDFFQWRIGNLSSCSASCGGGNQMETLKCKDLRTDVDVEESKCDSHERPVQKYFPCNQFGCEVRWITGPWEHCTTTCGTSGTQYRQVSCVTVAGAGEDSPRRRAAVEFSAYGIESEEEISEERSNSKLEESALETLELGKRPPKKGVGTRAFDHEFDEQGSKRFFAPDLDDRDSPTVGLNYVDPLLCQGEREPHKERPCNRVPCPAYWQPQRWTECSVTCGMGQQEVTFVCDGENNVGNPGGNQCGKRPREVRACFAGKCPQEMKEVFENCTKDESAFCRLPTLHRYCRIPKYYQLCCNTCAKILIPN